MSTTREQPFSLTWVFASMLIYVAAEVLIGGILGKVLMGKYVSYSLRFTVQGVLHLVSYFAGGVVVGMISPGIRLSEPALGAACAVGLVVIASIFTPFAWMRLSYGKLALAALIAYAVALAGARIGERITGNLR